jgi:hypothetical protein
MMRVDVGVQKHEKSSLMERKRMMMMKVGRKKRPVRWLFLEDERKGAWGELFQARIHQALQPRCLQ